MRPCGVLDVLFLWEVHLLHSCICLWTSVAQEKQHRTSAAISPIRSSIPRKRPCKRRPVHKVVPVSLPGKRASLLSGAMPDSCGGRDRGPREISVLDQLDQSGQSPKPASPPPADDAFSRYNLQRDMSSSEVIKPPYGAQDRIPELF